jgi:hypothetical protein
MKAIEDAIKEMKTLKPDELIKVYDMIIGLKNQHKKTEDTVVRRRGRNRVMASLSNCRADLGLDIIELRTDRV